MVLMHTKDIFRSLYCLDDFFFFFKLPFEFVFTNDKIAHKAVFSDATVHGCFQIFKVITIYYKSRLVLSATDRDFLKSFHVLRSPRYYRIS